MITIFSCQYEELHDNFLIPKTFEQVIEQQDGYLEVYSTIPSNDGGYIIIGEKVSKLFPANPQNEFANIVGFWIKLDETGEVLRYREFGISSAFQNEGVVPNAIVPIENGYAIAAQNYTKQKLQFIIINEQGATTKVNDVLTMPDDACFCRVQLEKLATNDFIISNGNFIAKLNSQGDFMWDGYYGGETGGIVAAPEGDFFDVVVSDETTSTIFRMNSDGIFEDILDLDTPLGSTVPVQLVQLNNGNFITSHVETSEFETFYNSSLIATKEDGTRVWENKYEDLRIRSVSKTEDGGVIICGSFTVNLLTGNIGGEAVLIKLTAAGTEEWRQFYGGELLEEGRSAIQLTDGGYFMAGIDFSISSTDVFPGNTGIYVIRTDRNGEF